MLERYGKKNGFGFRLFKIRGSIVTTERGNFWSDTFGNRKNPPVLLLMGAGCQGIFWTKTFCQNLADRGFFVIRFDQRDTGCSDYSDAPYLLLDMAKDAIAVLRAYGIEQARWVGLSLGGAIARLAAVHFPSAVHSLTLIATTYDFYPVLSVIRNEPCQGGDGLSPPHKTWFDWMREAESLPERSFFRRLFKHLQGWKILNGNNTPFPYLYYASLLGKSIVRQRSFTTIVRHKIALESSVRDVWETKDRIRVPTLILHGGSDPLFPKDHPERAACLIPESRLEIIENMGHNLCPCFQKRVIESIATFFSSIPRS